MVSDRALKLFVVAAVLAAAWYAGRVAAPGMTIPVAIVGLAAALWRPVLGLPAALAMGAAAVYVPGVAIGAAILVALLALISVWVKAALRRAALGNPPAARNPLTPGDGYSTF